MHSFRWSTDLAAARFRAALRLRCVSIHSVPATRDRWAWANARRQAAELFAQGYIASKSKHNLGTTVDLTIVDRATGTPLDMGVPWDTLAPTANTENATGVALAHRHLLREAMRKRGFRPYPKEWWHFEFPIAADPRDVPYGDDESDEAKTLLK